MPQPTRVTILRPPLLVPTWSDSGPLTPPIGPAYLASSLRQAGHIPRIVDGLGENPFQVTPLFDNSVMAIGLRSEQIVELIQPDTDLIGVSCMFSQDWPEVRRLIRMVRERFPRIPIVAGGEHITAVGAFTLESTPEVDVCVMGEGEETIVDLANALAEGAPWGNIPGLMIRTPEGGTRHTGPRTRIRDLDTIPWPAWDLVPLNNYLNNGLGYGVDRGRSMPMIATRGCPYQCTFCSNPEMWTTRWYARKPDEVLDEIQAYQDKYGATNFDFYDLTAIVKRSWIIEFTTKILERKMRFTWQLPSGTRSEAIDEEVCRLLYASGCRNMSYAPESGSPDVLKRIKKVVKLERLEASVIAAVRAGLNVKLNIIMGFPNESRSELKQTIKFLKRMGLAGVHDMSISLFSPYPGSELYHELRRNGQIPALSDEYFLSLGAYKDFSQSTSYTEGVKPSTINTFRIAGFMVFYGSQYAVRPWRVARLLQNLYQHRQESRLDKSLQDLVHRLKNRRSGPSSVKNAGAAS
jgi:anaerobic magnesium-protoporphyrin IX monomethyl ester cyclase